MKENVVIIVVLLFSFTRHACSQEISGLQLNGFIEVENKTYFESAGPDHIDDGRNQVLLLLKANASPVENAKLFSSIEIRDEAVNPERDRTYLKETYINYAGEAFELRMGKQIYAWGKADGINPTNNLNPVDYSDLLDTDEEEIGVTSLSIRYYKGDWTFEGIVIPVFEQAILPSQDSRWNLFPESLSLLPVKVNKPENKLGNTQFAVKASASQRGWDYSLSYYNGFEKLPAIFILTDADSAPSSIRLDYRRLQVIGADFATSFDRLGIRGEAAYFNTSPNLFYVLGVDYNFTNMIGDQDLYVICQWVQMITLPERNGDAAGSGNPNQLFRKAVMFKFDWEFTDYKKLEFHGVRGIDGRAMVLQPMLSSSLSDGLRVETGVDLIYGKKGGPLEEIEDNKRFLGRIIYNF